MAEKEYKDIVKKLQDASRHTTENTDEDNKYDEAVRLLKSSAIEINKIQGQIRGIIISLAGVLLGANMVLVDTADTIMLKIIYAMLYLFGVLSIICLILGYVSAKNAAMNQLIKATKILLKGIHNETCDINSLKEKRTDLTKCTDAGLILFIVTLILLLVYIVTLLFGVL